MRALTLLSVALALSACTVPKYLGDNPFDEEGDSVTADDGGTVGVSSQSGDDTGGSTIGESLTGGWSTITTPNDLSEPHPDNGTEFGDSSDTLGPGTTGGDETGPAMVCPTREGFECSFVTDCEQERCGELGSPFDAEGCPRVSCDDAPCGAGEVCYRPDQWGFEGCSPTLIGSENGEGQCSYTYDGDCGGNYCVPASEAPPAACVATTDEVSCLAAGCSAFDQRLPVFYDQQGECGCGEPVSECIYSTNSVGQEAPGLFYHPTTGETSYFALSTISAPYPWLKCFGDPAEPLACQHCRTHAPDCPK